MWKYFFFISQFFVANFAFSSSWDSCTINLSGKDGFEITYEVDHNSNTELSESSNLLWSNKSSGQSPIIRDPNARDDDDIRLVYSKTNKTLTAWRNGSHTSTASSSLYENNNGNVAFWLHHGDDLSCDVTEPPTNQNPQFEFGTLTDTECTTSQNGQRTCTIIFDNTYDSAKPKPLVFVMPTIDVGLSKLSLNQTELPSTASVMPLQD